MNHIYQLKFANETEWNTLLNSGVNWLQSAETIVCVGVITNPATFDEEGQELTPVTNKEGYHIDILAHRLIFELEPFCLESIPQHPIHGTGWAENSYIIVTKEYFTNQSNKSL